MSDKKILSVAASIINLFIILILLNSNSKAEENNIKYYSDDMGTLALMYHRFNESKYPSTNIKYEDVPILCDKFKIKKNLINPLYLS